jgi:hypothetical protein
LESLEICFSHQVLSRLVAKSRCYERLRRLETISGDTRLAEISWIVAAASATRQAFRSSYRGSRQLPIIRQSSSLKTRFELMRKDSKSWSKALECGKKRNKGMPTQKSRRKRGIRTRDLEPKVNFKVEIIFGLRSRVLSLGDQNFCFECSIPQFLPHFFPQQRRRLFTQHLSFVDHFFFVFFFV